MINPALTQHLDWRDYLQVYLDELEGMLAALPTRENAGQWTRLQLAWEIRDCHRALSGLLRRTREVQRSDQASPRLLADVAVVVEKCIDADLYLDEVATEISSLTISLFTSSGVEF